jgi:phenylpropionate dioxygenase-like ring-hydroxylating dioxygenase large terminal subunit
MSDTARISAERYFDLSYMLRERERVWRTNWLLAALATDLKEPKSTVTFDIGRDSIIIARTADGDLRAYHNACTHRGTRLLPEGPGQNALITCPYHAWCYNLDGSLKSVPDPHSFDCGLPAERLRLKPVQVEVWKGLVFVNMADDAGPLEEFLRPVTENIAPAAIAAMTLREDQTASVECNWKAIIDNFAELYHVNFIHPQHRRFVDCTAAVEEAYAHGHTGLRLPGYTTDPSFPKPDKATDIQAMQLEALGLDPDRFTGATETIPVAIQAAKRAQSGKNGFDYSAFSDPQLTEVWQYNLFPNVILSGSPEGLWVLRSRPHPTDPEQSYLDKWTLALPPDPALGGPRSAAPVLHSTSSAAAIAAEGRVARDCFSYLDVLSGNKSMTDTIDQDLSLLSRVQMGCTSGGFDSAWLSSRELRLAHFHDTLNRQMAG